MRWNRAVPGARLPEVPTPLQPLLGPLRPPADGEGEEGWDGRSLGLPVFDCSSGCEDDMPVLAFLILAVIGVLTGGLVVSKPRARRVGAGWARGALAAVVESWELRRWRRTVPPLDRAA